jgi:ABC-type antimicrobial peptide transport system permease subunit
MLILLLKELRHRWVVSLLTVLLMSFIISVLVIQTSLNSSAEDKINELSHNLGRNMLVLPEGTDLENFYMMDYGPEVMPEEHIQRLRASSLGRHVSQLSPRLYGNVTVRGTDLIIVGQKFSGPKYGNFRKDFIAVSKGTAQSLGLSVNDTLDIAGNKLQVFRIIDPPPKGMDMAVFVPLSTAQKILRKPGKINALHMGGCWCELDVPAFAAKIEKILPGTMAITIDGMAKAQQEIIGVMERYSTVLWVVGSILATGSIFFLILYTIYKGSREIGLLLSIGFSPGRIIMKNISVSVITALTGACTGYLLSIPLMKYVGIKFMRVSLGPSWDLLPYFLAASLIIAFIAASFPSWYVTRLDPTKLLREE